MAPEILIDGKYNEKSDMYSLGCIIYELFNLSKYYSDREYDEIKKIDFEKYNNKWQEIINSLLEIDYNKRMDINEVYNIISNEININIENLNNKKLVDYFKEQKEDIKSSAMFNLNNNFNTSISRLNNEYILCCCDNDLLQIGCSFILENNNIYHWKFTMLGAKNTPYEGGMFFLNAIFPFDYPKHGPEIKFTTKIYHTCVDNNSGLISFNHLNEWRNTGSVPGFEVYTMKNALIDIFCLFYIQSSECAYDKSMCDSYYNDRDKFNAEAKKWTELYAKF